MPQEGIAATQSLHLRPHSSTTRTRQSSWPDKSEPLVPQEGQENMGAKEYGSGGISTSENPERVSELRSRSRCLSGAPDQIAFRLRPALVGKGTCAGGTCRCLPIEVVVNLRDELRVKTRGRCLVRASRESAQQAWTSVRNRSMSTPRCRGRKPSIYFWQEMYSLPHRGCCRW